MDCVEVSPDLESANRTEADTIGGISGGEGSAHKDSRYGADVPAPAEGGADAGSNADFAPSLLLSPLILTEFSTPGTTGHGPLTSQHSLRLRDARLSHTPPPLTSSPGASAVAITLGNARTCAIVIWGGILSWGNDADGKPMIRAVEYRGAPVFVPGAARLTHYVCIAPICHADIYCADSLRVPGRGPASRPNEETYSRSQVKILAEERKQIPFFELSLFQN